MRTWLIFGVTILATLASLPTAGRGDEAAAERVREILKRPMLLTSDDQSVAKRFTVVTWVRQPDKGHFFWSIIERHDADVAMVTTHLDGTPMTVHVNHRTAKFYELEKAGWVVEEGPLPRMNFTARVKQPSPDIYLDLAERLRRVPDVAPALTCSEDGTRFRLSALKSDDYIAFDVCPDPNKYPILMYSGLHKGEEIGYRILVDAEAKPNWTRKEVLDVVNALHNEELAGEVRGQRVPVRPECPIGVTRALAWEIPKRLEMKILPQERPAELLRRTLARGSACIAASNPAMSRFNIEREIRAGEDRPVKVTYERDGEEVALIIRCGSDEPVALIRPGWIFARVPERGWVLCDQLYAVGGANADKQWGWKIGRSIGNGGLSFLLDPLAQARELKEAEVTFNEAKNELSLTTADRSVALELTPDFDEFPLRSIRVQTGQRVDKQSFVTGEAVKATWTKVTPDLLRTEFKPIEEAFDDPIRTAIHEQLISGQSDTDRTASQALAEAVKKLDNGK